MFTRDSHALGESWLDQIQPRACCLLTWQSAHISLSLPPIESMIVYRKRNKHKTGFQSQTEFNSERTPGLGVWSLDDGCDLMYAGKRNSGHGPRRDPEAHLQHNKSIAPPTPRSPKQNEKEETTHTAHSSCENRQYFI